jgi:hypothetical protein
MRTQLAIAATLAAFAAGCAPGMDDELKGLVDGVAPTDAQMLGCDWAKTWGNESGAYYRCVYVAPGRLRRVGTGVLTDIAAQGFTVTCRTDRTTVELTGARDGAMMYADVLAPGFVHGRNLTASDIAVPRGSVVVELVATNEDAGVQPGRLCAVA